VAKSTICDKVRKVFASVVEVVEHRETESVRVERIVITVTDIDR